MVEGISVVMVMVDRLLDRDKLDPLEGEGAMLEPILVTMLPMPIQKAMMRPANRPTMAPCPNTWHTFLSRCQPYQTVTAVPRTQGESPAKPPPRSIPARDCGARGVTHRRVGTRKEHPEAEESQQRPPNHSKDADGCLGRQG